MTKSNEDKKLKIVFIDDEKLVRQLLMNCVDWSSLGYEVAGDSPGGQHALELIEDVNPDVAFVDICMPVMDGIELSRLILQRLPHTRVVIVTGHQEFDYAKEGIKVGVSDFLLKPINPKEITAAAQKTREAILLEKSEREKVEELKQRLKESYPYLRERYLNQLACGNYMDEDLEPSLDYFGFSFESSFFQVAVLSIDQDPKDNKSDAEQKMMLLIQSKDIINEIIRGYKRLYCYSNTDEIVIISNNCDVDLFEVLDFIKTELSYAYACKVSVGMSNAFHEVKHIHNAFIQAMEAQNYKLVCGKGHIVEYSEIIAPEKEYNKDDRQMNMLSFYMKAGLESKAEEAACSTLLSHHNGEIKSIEQLHAAGARMLSECLAVMTEFSIPSADIFGGSDNSYEHIFTIETLPQMKAFIKQCAGKIAHSVKKINQYKMSSIISLVKAYIDENIANPKLTLSGTAKKFYLNASYLSRAYKQETGSTFVEYLKKMRIEKAIELLKEGDLKVYQLCEMVGIEDPHYFSIMFKKVTGITVSEYKQNLKRT